MTTLIYYLKYKGYIKQVKSIKIILTKLKNI